MTEITTHTPGAFCWVDLATPDPEAAGAFYTALFGWTTMSVPPNGAGAYTMFKLRDQPVAGMFTMSQALRAEGVSPHWQSLIAVADADASAAKVEALGGVVLRPPFDVLQAGRKVVIEDSVGAAVSLWQGRKHTGARIIGEPGALCWNELYAPNTKVAGAFYEGLLGWSARRRVVGSESYTEFRNGERPVGGMIEIKPAWGEVSAHWAVYFCVADCDEAMAEGVALGGDVMVEATNLEGIGRFGYLRDPMGAHFAVIRLASA